MVDRLVNSEANAHRIAVVENCFGSSGQPLAVPGRVLVGEGVLTKMCRKKEKPRQFFLFNDILVYGNIVISKKKYNKQHIIPLEEVKLESLDDNDQHRNGWVIQTATKSFAVYAATPVEKEEWVAHINKCVGDLLRKSGKKASETHAAVWVPDTEANICMHCKKTQFTMITRRHHCRKCGSVVCGPCSNKRFLLPNQSSKPLRVCLNCYDMLSKAKTNHNSSEDNGYNKDGKFRSRFGDSSGEDDSDEDDDGVNKSSDQSHDQRSFPPSQPETSRNYVYPSSLFKECSRSHGRIVVFRAPLKDGIVESAFSYQLIEDVFADQKYKKDVIIVTKPYWGLNTSSYDSADILARLAH